MLRKGKQTYWRQLAGEAIEYANEGNAQELRRIVRHLGSGKGYRRVVPVDEEGAPPITDKQGSGTLGQAFEQGAGPGGVGRLARDGHEGLEVVAFHTSCGARAMLASVRAPAAAGGGESSCGACAGVCLFDHY